MKDLDLTGSEKTNPAPTVTPEVTPDTTDTRPFSIEDVESNEVLLARAAASREDFYRDTRAMIKSIPEKPDGKCPINLEMMRESVIARGYIPKF